MSLAERFGFFDQTQPYSVSYGELPHWEQEGATYFITFRTIDSLPTSVNQLLIRQRDDWLRNHGIDPGKRDWRSSLRQLSHVVQRSFHREYVTKLEAALDKGHGACELRTPRIAKIVTESLMYFDGYHLAAEQCRKFPSDSITELRSNSATTEANQPREVRYHISDFVVMPNHVHVMVCFLPGIRLLDQCRSWKHFTGRKINAELGTSGQFWQSESFDHLVRDADHFQQFRNYIAANRATANLKENEGFYYRCPE